MDGCSGRAGAVCATTWPRNPVRVALAVSESGSPPDGPLLLAGAGADLFAADRGFPEMGAASRSNPILGSPAGTVGAVAVDSERHLAAATSTGGRQGQLRGRVGDSPFIGAGTWADGRDCRCVCDRRGRGVGPRGLCPPVGLGNPRRFEPRRRRRAFYGGCLEAWRRRRLDRDDHVRRACMRLRNESDGTAGGRTHLL